MAEHGRAPEPDPPFEIIPIRTRWVPKPEQTQMLESIFKNGMFNPSKEETSSIRMLLENYGELADANVFYWFQNRRSKSRRIGRQLRASLRAIQVAEEQNQAQAAQTGGRGGQTIMYPDYMSVGVGPTNSMSNGTMNTGSGSPSYMVGSSSSSASVHHTSNQYEQGPIMCSAAYGLNHQPAGMMVFINGVAIQIGKDPINIKEMFDGKFLMYHCSGMPIHVNEDGSVLQNLKHGESYFVVEHP